MKKTNRKMMISVIVLALLCNSSCGTRVDSETEKDKKITTSNSTVISEVPPHIEETVVKNNVHISIKADVEASDKELMQVKLTHDENNLNRLYNDWIKPKYPNAKKQADESYDYGWGISQSDGDVSMSVTASKTGAIRFIDVAKNINGTSDEDEHIFESGYITNDIPKGMNIKAKEAEAEAVKLITPYTPFEYKANNIRVINDIKRNTGFYDINMRAFLNGVTICVVVGGDRDFYNLCFEARVSKEGIFSFQGSTNLKVIDNKKVVISTKFEDFMDYYLKDISVLAAGKDIEVRRIYQAYLPEISYADDPYITLTPVWCFETVDSRNEDGQLITLKYTIAYSVETGKLMGKFF